MPDADTPLANALALDADIARRTGSGEFGLTEAGFVPKPFARLLAEKLALARALLGDAADLNAGSAIRAMLEVTALEDARTWAALATAYDNAFVTSATGEALSRLGEELGLPRPHVHAAGRVTLTLEPAAALPAGFTLTIPRGARMLTEGRDHAATDAMVELTVAASTQEVPVFAFFPGPEHDLDPAVDAERITRFNTADPALAEMLALQAETGGGGGAPGFDVSIEHTEPLTGGAGAWNDARYRQLLLRAPRSVWSADAVRIAVSLVPGVRQVQVRDASGGLDVHQSLFGTLELNFIERLFGAASAAASPYRITVLVAPTPAAIWDGPEGLQAAVLEALEDVRPLGIVPNVESADTVGIGVAAQLTVRGIPLPSGAAANTSPVADALKRRLLDRVRAYVDDLGFGEPVRLARVIAAMMAEPGVADARGARLLRFPPDFDATRQSGAPTELPAGANAELRHNQIAVLVDDPRSLTVA